MALPFWLSQQTWLSWPKVLIQCLGESPFRIRVCCLGERFHARPWPNASAAATISGAYMGQGCTVRSQDPNPRRSTDVCLGNYTRIGYSRTVMWNFYSWELSSPWLLIIHSAFHELVYVRAGSQGRCCMFGVYIASRMMEINGIDNMKMYRSHLSWRRFTDKSHQYLVMLLLILHWVLMLFEQDGNKES